MARAAHLEALNTRHSEIDAKLSTEMNRPNPDSIRIAELKRQKLRLKDEIRREN